MCSLTPALVLVCWQAVSKVNQRVAQLLHLFEINENKCVAQFLHLCWCAGKLFQRLEMENQRVAQLLHLFWCAVRLFQRVETENQRVAQLLHLFWKI